MHALGRFLLSVVALGGAFTASALEIPLEFERLSHDDEGFKPRGREFIHALSERPEGQWTLPDLVSDEPCYALLDLGAGQRLAVFDKESEDDSSYARLYFDADGDGDLTKAVPIIGEVNDRGSFVEVAFPDIEMTVDIDGKAAPYIFSIELERYQPGMVLSFVGALSGVEMDTVFLHLYSQCAYKANFEFQGTSYELWLGDGNVNGQFGEAVEFDQQTGSTRRYFTATDTIYLSPVGVNDRPVSQDLGNMLVLGDTLFDAKFDIAGGKLTLEPFTEPTGRAKLATPMDQVLLRGTKADRSIMMFAPAEEFPLPVDEYRLLTYEINRKDEQGDGWQLCAGSHPEAESVEVAEGAQVTLPYGEPYTSRAVVEGGKMRRGFLWGTRAELGFECRGAGGESVRDVSHVSGSSTKLPMDRWRMGPAPPEFKVTKADGEVVAKGAFRYG